jgi:hypothetical protein
VANWKTEFTKTEIPQGKLSETLTTVEFAQFFQFVQFFILSSFHFLSVWGRKSSFSPKSVIIKITLEH